jgi:hypothetical protein
MADLSLLPQVQVRVFLFSVVLLILRFSIYSTVFYLMSTVCGLSFMVMGLIPSTCLPFDWVCPFRDVIYPRLIFVQYSFDPSQIQSVVRAILKTILK